MTQSEASTAVGGGHGQRETLDTRSGPAPTAQEHRGEGPVVLGRYRLHRQLGAGAFGTVWLARDERLERDVAVKMVPRARIVGGRFEREARAAARLAHPGIVTLYEAGTDRDGAYLVSELVRGSTLGELLEAGRLSDRELVRIGIALCDALAHAHAANVVHRDVKPSNVLVPDSPSNPASVAKLTDFGVARIVGGDTLTRTGDVLGTAAYMAPEQAEGRDTAAPADLYSLALVLYEGLTGVNPVRTGTAAQRSRRLGAYLPPLRRQRRDLPRELGQAIDQALRPRVRERGTIEELRAALTTVINRMSDRPGIVASASAWRPGHAEAVEAQASEPLTASPPSVRRARPDPAVAPPPPSGPPPSGPPATAADTATDDESPTRWRDRGLAALATAAIAGWMAATVLPASSVPPLAIALLAATLVAALPRLGWLACVLAAGVWLAADGRTGAALAVGLVGLLSPVLLPQRPAAWPLPAGAPALGAIGLAGAWPAIAGRARTAWARAALGATGWMWMILGAELAGADLYLGPPPRSPPADQWERSVGVTVHHVLEPLIRSGAFAPAVVWAGAAVILPWVVRGRALGIDFVLASAWASGLVAATYASLRLAGGALGGATVHHPVLGGVSAFAVALAPSIVRTCRTGWATARFP